MVGLEPFGELVLVAVAILQHRHGRERGEQPGQLGDFGHIALTEEHRLGRIQSAREKIQRHILRILAPLLCVIERGHRVVVGDEIIGLALVLELDRRLHHAEVVAHMQRAGRLDAGKNPHGVEGSRHGRRIQAALGKLGFSFFNRMPDFPPCAWTLAGSMTVLVNQFVQYKVAVAALRLVEAHRA